MQSQRTFASILIWATVLMFVALLMHPAAASHGPRSEDALAAVYAARSHLAVMHGVAIGLQLTVVACIIAFCRAVGFDHPLAVLGAVAFAASAAGISVAASLDGFLIPAFAAPHLALNDGTPLDMRPMIAAGAIVIQYATKFSIAAIAASAALLSWQLLSSGTMRVAAVAGLVLAAIQCVALFAFAVLTPHNVAFSALPLLLWQLVLGVVWMREAR